MDIETKVELKFNVRLGEDEMDILATMLGAVMVYKEDAMDGAAEDALISAMKALPEANLFYMGNRIRRANALGAEARYCWQGEDPT